MAERPTPPPTQIRPDVWLDARRALWFARSRLLVVADLHWGYAESHRRRGNLLPLWGDSEIAARLRALIAHHRPAAMLWLGDSLHTVSGRAAAEGFLAASDCPPTTVLAGNHDVRWSRVNAPHFADQGYFFHHGDSAPEVPSDHTEVIGHHHPAVAWNDGAGTRLKLPALVEGPRRLILPAFSPWAGGTPWNDVLQPGETLWAIAPHRVFRWIASERASTPPVA